MRRDLTILSLALFLCLAPFLGKAVHLDDPLFLWSARQIQEHPLDPYGFQVNWDSVDTPADYVIQNPPLASYYLAGVSALLGWNEYVLHLAFLMPALAAAWGLYFLARRFCRHPLEAALMGTLTPVFLVSATTLMCDVTMLA